LLISQSLSLNFCTIIRHIRNPLDFTPYQEQKQLHNEFKARAYGERWSFLSGSGREGVILAEDRWKRKKRVVLVRFNQRFGFNGGGGGGDNGATARVLGNLILAIGLTYLSMTGQLGWLLQLFPFIGLFAYSFLI